MEKEKIPEKSEKKKTNEKKAEIPMIEPKEVKGIRIADLINGKFRKTLQDQFGEIDYISLIVVDKAQGELFAIVHATRDSIEKKIVNIVCPESVSLIDLDKFTEAIKKGAERLL